MYIDMLICRHPKITGIVVTVHLLNILLSCLRFNGLTSVCSFTFLVNGGQPHPSHFTKPLKSYLKIGFTYNSMANRKHNLISVSWSWLTLVDFLFFFWIQSSVFQLFNVMNRMEFVILFHFIQYFQYPINIPVLVRRMIICKEEMLSQV